ncbi:MAG: hypothetical protein ABH842_06205 [Candidatus Micrarchaeota archaeon]
MYVQKRQPQPTNLTARIRLFAERILEERIRKTSLHNRTQELNREILFLVNAFVNGYWSATSSPLGATLHDYGGYYPNREFQSRDAIAHLRTLAERGVDCSAAIQALGTHLQDNRTPHLISNNIIEAIRVLALSGADFSHLVPFLEKQTDNARSRFCESAPGVLDIIKRRDQILHSQTTYRIQMEQRLTALSSRFEEAWSMPLPFMTLVTDATTSSRFVRREIFESDTVTDFTGYALPSALVTATAERHRLYGRIVLWRTSMGDPHFDAIVFHEFAHLLKEPGKCFDCMKKTLFRTCNDKSQADYLTRILSEGFAEFCSHLTTDTPILRNQDSKHLDEVIHEAEIKGWEHIATSDRYHFYVYEIGLNFFTLAHSLLRYSPLDYALLLSKTPPSPEELLSHNGGMRWAERVRFSKA